jgi:transposase-like protein
LPTELDSAGETIDFMLSPKRDLTAASLLRLVLSGTGGERPQVIYVDGHRAETAHGVQT